MAFLDKFYTGRMKDETVQKKANVWNTRQGKKRMAGILGTWYSQKQTVCSEEQSLIYTIATNITITTIKYLVPEY